MNERQPVGQTALRNLLGLRVPPPSVESYIVAGRRQTEVHGSRTVEYYPKTYEVDGSITSQIKFALKHEPIDLGVLVATLKTMDPAELIAWIRQEPTGAYSRRAWFLYETFVGQTLDVPSAVGGNYVTALDPKRHFVADRRDSTRHRVIDNLPGTPGFCPIVRLTTKLAQFGRRRLGEEVRTLTNRYDPNALARAVSYL